MTEVADKEMELTLPMVADIEIAAARAAGNLARQTGMSSERIDEMAHAIIEACINAREHGGCADQRIYLRFVAGSTPEGLPRIDVWITDHGKGFDPVKVRSRRNQPGTRRGWGLQIMEAHMDEVEIESGEHGTTIHMVKIGEKKV
jgi:anti-sigma regulatory factor (Ser/Thr protein kinase)